jgi:alanine racemase
MGVTRPIYLLSPAAPAERRAVVEAGDVFIPAVSEFEEAAEFSALAEAAGRRQPVHLVFDTGMGRIGMIETEAVGLAVRIAALPGLVIDSVASHFPSADEDAVFTAAQLGRFHALLEALAAAGLGRPRHHVANSAGAVSQPRRGREMIRAGLMLYGVAPIPGRDDDLRPAVAWHARVVLARTLPAGHGISYGRTYITAAPTRVATLPVGYADGYPRHLSGRGAWVRLGHAACPVLGRVTMDQIVVAAPDDVKPGDVATLMGGDGPGPAEVAERAGTIAHDIFCGLGGRVGRILV